MLSPQAIPTSAENSLLVNKDIDLSVDPTDPSVDPFDPDSPVDFGSPPAAQSLLAASDPPGFLGCEYHCSGYIMQYTLNGDHLLGRSDKDHYIKPEFNVSFDYIKDKVNERCSNTPGCASFSFRPNIRPACFTKDGLKTAWYNMRSNMGFQMDYLCGYDYFLCGKGDPTTTPKGRNYWQMNVDIDPATAVVKPEAAPAFPDWKMGKDCSAPWERMRLMLGRGSAFCPASLRKNYKSIDVKDVGTKSWDQCDVANTRAMFTFSMTSSGCCTPGTWCL